MNQPQKFTELAYELYLKEHYRHQSLHEKNLINQENAMITLSIGLLAALAALGDRLITVNKTLAIAGIICLSLTIVQIIVGYYLSNVFFAYIKKKLQENYEKHRRDGVTRLSDGTSDSRAGKINDVLNITTPMTFLLSLLAFIILIITYAGGL